MPPVPAPSPNRSTPAIAGAARELEITATAHADQPAGPPTRPPTPSPPAAPAHPWTTNPVQRAAAPVRSTRPPSTPSSTAPSTPSVTPGLTRRSAAELPPIVAPSPSGSNERTGPPTAPTELPIELKAEPPRRRSKPLVLAATFALGGIVGAGGFGLGQRYGDSGPDSTDPVVNVAAPAVTTETTPAPAVPIPNPSPAPLGAEPAAEVARILGPSVVQVETSIGQGSGVVYADGLLLTNHHVIEGADQVRIRTSEGRVFDVEVLGSDPRNDIAVLSARGADLAVATIGSSAALQPGQLTVAIGSPFQLQQTVTAGIVSSTNRPVPNQAGGVSAMIQTDAPINPGNSGGALANRSGELVGINASIRTDGQSNSNVGIGFAVPIDTAIEVAERIVNGDSLQPGVLGVTGERQDSDVGVPIAEVVDDSGAEASGLRPGDRVLTIDGVPVTNITELTGLVQSHFSGDTVELEVQRGSTNLTVEAELS